MHMNAYIKKMGAPRQAKKFFTVEYESGGRLWHKHVEAYDSIEATRYVMDGNKSAIWAKVVREIDRAEFVRLNS